MKTLGYQTAMDLANYLLPKYMGDDFLGMSGYNNPNYWKNSIGHIGDQTNTKPPEPSEDVRELKVKLTKCLSKQSEMENQLKTLKEKHSKRLMWFVFHLLYSVSAAFVAGYFLTRFHHP
jgi:hypothetical protein